MSKFFLYNGVKLPALPEWDRNRYPYAFIYIVTLDGTTGVYTLVVSSSSVMGYDGNGIICPAATVGQRYTVSEDSWAAAAASDDFYIKRDNLIYTVWANFDVLNSDGSVYVAASDPVPVADKFPLQGWLNWHVIGLCSRPLPVSVREPVAYLYNGVRLPKLPELDKEKYPYAFIENLGVFGCYLYLTKEHVYYYSGYKVPAPYLRCKANGDGWGNFTEGSSEYNTNFALWANHDIYYNGDNSENKYLSASKPVPVYG